jgi:2-oxoglutarate dehydrogenase E2 component (dihydrolipoamide succinyltransferase)
VVVGTKLAVICVGAAAGGNGSAAGAAPAPAEAPPQTQEQTDQPAQPVQAEGAAPPPADAGTTAAPPPPQAAPAAAAPAGPSGLAQAPPAPVAEERGPATEEASPAPAQGTIEQASRQAPPQPQAPPQAQPSGDGGGSMVLSPVVRRLLNEHQLDPASITGTGAGGRITRADVQAVIDGGGGARAATAAQPQPQPQPQQQAPAAAAPPATVTATVQPGQHDEIVPFTNIRRRTAEHMVRSKATSAHTLTAIEVDYDKVERVRRAHKDAFKAQHGASLTYLPFIARATIDAIADYPNINSSVGDDELIIHRDVHLGIAVDLDLQGLIVPVVRSASDKRLPALARDIADLAGRARNKKLGADEIAGGTFTITNPGPFGTFLTAPIINQPQVAILSTDGIKKRPVVVELPDGSDGIAIHPTGMLALSFDHRVIDGAYASAFIARVKEILETRDWEQEL